MSAVSRLLRVSSQAQVYFAVAMVRLSALVVSKTVAASTATHCSLVSYRSGGHVTSQLSLELETKVAEDYTKFYNYREGPF